MLPLRLGRNDSAPLRILCLGAHSDDIEIGCGGTLMELAGGSRELRVEWIVFSAGAEREREARASASALLVDAASLELNVQDFRDGFFPDQWAALKETLEAVEAGSSPDVIFTHHRRDGHQDHRVVSELTWNTFRNHLILEYEVPKYDGDLGQPNVYVPLSRDVARRKATHLVESFPSQRERAWFDDATFLALSRLRGLECAAADGHAEGFHGPKLSVAP